MAVQYIGQGVKRLAASTGIKEKLEELEEAYNSQKKINDVHKKKCPMLQNNEDEEKGNVKKDNYVTKDTPLLGDDTKKKGNEKKKAVDKYWLSDHDHKWKD
eukprot:510152-Ditylum_brightwellii.AAC.1